MKKTSKKVPVSTLRSKALKKLGWKVKGVKTGHECCVMRCTRATSSSRVIWCAMHRAEIRKLQVKLNGEAHLKRKADGVAGHHLTYKGKPTPWAKENPKAAKKLGAERAAA